MDSLSALHIDWDYNSHGQWVCHVSEMASHLQKPP